MAITPCSELTAAEWIVTSGHQPQQLIDFGPPGFSAYVRLRFLPDPVHHDQSENDVNLAHDAPLEAVQLRAAVQVLAGHTRTPDDCYFCLWDGWGWTVHGSDGAWTLDREPVTAAALADWPVSSNPPPAGIVPAAVDRSGEPPSPPRTPKVVLPHRAYFLFRGSASDIGNWPRSRKGSDHNEDMVTPAFIWPADHAWCLANDVDPHWAGIGANAAAIAQLMADPLLDVVPADPRDDQPRYR